MNMQPGDHVVAAALEGDAQKVAALLGEHADLRTYRTMFGVSALHAAHFAGHAEVVSVLRPDEIDGFLAAELGDVDALDAALASTPSLATAFSPGGSTALHGSYRGQVAATRRLLDAGADVSATTRDSFLQISPLGSAVAATPGGPQPSDDADVVLSLVRLLLDAGADTSTCAGSTA